MKHRQAKKKKIHVKVSITWGNSWKAPAVSWFRSEDPPITITGLCRGNMHLINQVPQEPCEICRHTHSASCIQAASVCWILPAVHVSVGHSTQSMNESRSRHHQAGTWSGYKKPQETATCEIQTHQLLTRICSVTKGLTSQWDTQWLMLHSMPIFVTEFIAY